MMNCTEASRFVDSWELSGDAESFETFRVHLESCPSCDARYSRLLPLILRDARGFAPVSERLPDPDFTDAVMQAVRSRIPETPRPFGNRMRRLALIAAGIMVVFAVGLGIGARVGGRNADIVDVRFVYEGQQDARSISLVGDFNSWNADDYRLRRVGEGSVWEITIKLRKSRLYSYGFVIDGVHFVPDPSVPERVDDGFGNSNSLLRL